MRTVKPMVWENFLSTTFVKGEQRTHRVSDRPLVEIFGDGIANRIGLRIGTEKLPTVPSRLQKMTMFDAELESKEGKQLLRLSVRAGALHRQFYHLAVAVSERVIVDKIGTLEALDLELECFGELLQERSFLGIERQLGLLGELLFLERIVAEAGIQAFASWVGPMGEPHDFRIHKKEFEVKTTVSSTRIHTINGEAQLVPSLGYSLALISIQLGPAGAGYGFSLTDQIEKLDAIFSQNHAIQNLFRSNLETLGVQLSDLLQYARKWDYRRPLAIVPINSKMPVISQTGLRKILGGSSYRIESVQYDLNVEGLEFEDGTTVFKQAVTF